MKVLSRDFTIREKILIILLVLVLIGIGYYRFFLLPTNESIERAKSETEILENDYLIVDAKIKQLEKMQAELDKLNEEGSMKYMPSYNNGKAVRQLLNDVLGGLEYSITFQNLTRSSDQVRRIITIQFSAPDYTTVRRVLSELVNSEYRCMIGDLNCTPETRNSYSDGGSYITGYSVSATVTFYETMVGGTPDVDLPADSSAAH